MFTVCKTISASPPFIFTITCVCLPSLRFISLCSLEQIFIYLVVNLSRSLNQCGTVNLRRAVVDVKADIDGLFSIIVKNWI